MFNWVDDDMDGKIAKRDIPVLAGISREKERLFIKFEKN